MKKSMLLVTVLSFLWVGLWGTFAFSKPFYFAPYVDITLYPFPLLSQISTKTNNYNYILGFIVADKNKCIPSWGWYYSLDKGPDARINGQHKFFYDELKIVKNKGGKIMVSFGGQQWTPLFKVCNEASLLNQYKQVINKLGTYYLDYDIEGSILSDHASINRLIGTLIKLQEAFDNKLHIWLTLPVTPNGFDSNWLYVVEQAIKRGLHFDWINIMTMYFGSAYKDTDIGDYSIKAAKTVQNQLKNLYRSYGIGKSDIEIKNMIWITPMIGLNEYTKENFTLEDAKQIGSYVKTNKLGRLSYWSLNRDHPCPNITNLLKCSWKNNQATDYEYFFTFKNTLIFSDTRLPPYDFPKFRHALDQCKLTYPDSQTTVIDKGHFSWYKSDFFYALKDGVMYFVLRKLSDQVSKVRDELRQQQNQKDLGWPKDTSTVHYLKTTVKLQSLNPSIPEYTFLQVHEKQHNKPLLRLVVKYLKNGFQNHIWAVIRNTVDNNVPISTWVDLWPLMENTFDHYEIYVGNNRLKIYRNGFLLVNRDISYWPGKLNYFKAGIYDSWNSKGPFELKIGYSQFELDSGDNVDYEEPSVNILPANLPDLSVSYY